MRALIVMVLRPRPRRTAKISPSRNDLGVMTSNVMTDEAYWLDSVSGVR